MPKPLLSFQSQKALSLLADALLKESIGEPIKRILHYGSLRWCFEWPSQTLIIDLHPAMASALLLKNAQKIDESSPSLIDTPLPLNSPSMETFQNELSLFEQNFPSTALSHQQLALWKKRLEGRRLSKAWVSQLNTLHLELIHSNKEESSLFFRLQSRRPNLYYNEKSAGPTPESWATLWPTQWAVPEGFMAYSSESPNESSEYDFKLYATEWLCLQNEAIRAQKLEAIDHHFLPQLETLERRLAKMEKTLSQSEDLEKLTHEGQLLQAHRHLYQSGMKQLNVLDWVSGTSIDLPITKRNIQAQIEHSFHRAKGLLAHYDQLKIQISRLKEKWKLLEELYLKERQATPLPLYKPKNPPADKVKKSPQKKELPKPYRGFSYKGARIYVGKTSSDNMVVSFQIAHGNDLWLHVSDYPGSHVVVKGPEPFKREWLEAAALLAHHYSGARKLIDVVVTYTEAKWIKKLPEAKTGTVAVMQSKSYHSHYDTVKLAELLTCLDSSI